MKTLRDSRNDIPVWIRVIGGFVIWGLGWLKARHEEKIGWDRGGVESCESVDKVLRKRARRSEEADQVASLRKDVRFRDGVEEGVDTP